jgi:uracil-DNA glycosylase
MSTVAELRLGKAWAAVIGEEFDKPYMLELATSISDERKSSIIYPDQDNVFRAFRETPFDKVKVVILGQDPYHDGNATGLAFECGLGITPSMRKINDGFTEQFPSHFSQDVMLGQLGRWASEGVLLLNTALTVRKKEPGSHTHQWQPFIKQVLLALNALEPLPVYLLWGGYAQKYKEYIAKGCAVLEAEHPVAGVYSGRSMWKHNNCFIRANEELEMVGVNKIKWE